MNTVLVTGSTGFLGTYIVKQLVTKGYHVIACGRDRQKLQKLARSSRHISPLPGNLSELSSHSVKVDYVIHAAALSTVWGPWSEFHYHNVEGTEHVIDFCHKNSVKRLVYISSPSIYSGRSHKLAIQESEFDKNNRLNNYIRSKIMAEKIIQTAHNTGLETVILRPRGIFGVGDTSIVPRLLHANNTFGIPLFNNGKNLVDMTCVENVAHAVLLAITSPVANGGIYNITNGEPREFKSILDLLFSGIGVEPRYKRRNLALMYGSASIVEAAYRALRLSSEPPLTRYTIATLGYSQTLDISRARTDLGYSPICGLEEGIRHYVTSYK